MKRTIQLPWLDRFYLVRIATVLMILAIVAVQDTLCRGHTVYHPGLILFGVVYPHLLQVLLGRFEGRRHRGRYSLLVDGVFAGAAMPAFGFSAIPCLVLVAINLFNWMALGGTYLTMAGILALLAGLGLYGVFAGFELFTTSCASADFLGFGVLLAYFLAIAWIVFRYSSALQKHCDELQVKADAAEMGWRRAERTLMAVLPHSASLEHANGGIVCRRIDDATVLLADFNLPGDTAENMVTLRAIFGACDEILSRHGMEAVRTFGRRYLAVSGKAAGSENALVAALEIVAYLRDHGIAPELAEKSCGVRLAIHSGPIVAGLIQAEKFSYDILGAAVDELSDLLDESKAASVVISETARARLQRDWRLVPLPGKTKLPAFTPIEHGQV